MLQDILTVMWKESKGLFRFRGSRIRFLLTLLTPVLFSVVMPLQAGIDFLHEAVSTLLACVLSFMVVGLTVPDTFAGERERKTLSTLLASRLPDRAIMLGKMAVCVGLALSVTWLSLLLSVLVVNVADWQGSFEFYTPPIALANFGLSFLLALLGAGLGVLISMRSKTVQEAAQVLMSILLVPAVVLQMVGLLFIDRLRVVIENLDGPQLLMIVLAVLLVLDAVVLTLATTRFRRSRLYLE